MYMKKMKMCQVVYSHFVRFREALIKIMQAGLDAPSGCNKQTTSLIAVDNPDVLKQLYSDIRINKDDWSYDK